MNDRLEELELSESVSEETGCDELAVMAKRQQARVANRPTNADTAIVNTPLKDKFLRKKKRSSRQAKVEAALYLSDRGLARARHLDSLYVAVEDLEKRIGEITRARHEINLTKEQILTRGLSSAREAELNQRVCAMMNRTCHQAQTIRPDIQRIQKETQSLAFSPNKGLVDKSDVRIRQFLTSALARKFREELHAYQKEQRAFHIETQKRLERQILCVHPEATQEEVSRMIEGGEDRDRLYQQAVLKGSATANAKIVTIHHEVAEKQRAIESIEKSIASIRGLFLDFALLTENQGGQLDSIEYEVKRATDYTEQGNEELYESYQYRKKIRKRRRVLLVVGTIIVVVTVVILL